MNSNMSSKKEILNNDVDTIFRRDVIRAKENYRRRRYRIIILILIVIFLATMVTNITNIMKKRNLNNEIAAQSEAIEKLDKDHQVNEVLIEKLKDPIFITDLVRQEYGMSYSGELIFNLPLQEKFMDSAVKSIMKSDLNNREAKDSSELIDDTKIPKLESVDKDKKSSTGNSSKKSTSEITNDNTETTKDSNNKLKKTTTSSENVTNSKRTGN